MASNNAQSASTTGPDLQRRVRDRFGVLPNFFRLSPETPEITEKLWGFAQAAYLDNPLPSVFKERLFVHLSRFCAVRYCIARHTGFLIGLGHPSGDKSARTESVEAVVKLFRRPLRKWNSLFSPSLATFSCKRPTLPNLSTRSIGCSAPSVSSTLCFSWPSSAPRIIGPECIPKSSLKMTSSSFSPHEALAICITQD